jgi:hypothetical protein
MTNLTVISGGQSGVDRAALDVAVQLGLPLGRGWCPRGRWAEDGPIPERYPFRETASENVETRTELNVLEASGVLVLSTGAPKDGTNFTTACAKHHGKPYLEVDLDDPIPPQDVRAWIATNRVDCLDVAGPRESHRPGFVYRAAFDFLLRVFQPD